MTTSGSGSNRAGRAPCFLTVPSTDPIHALHALAPIIPLRPLTRQGSFVGTLAELRELVAMASGKAPRSIPLTERPLDRADEALRALAEGRVVGRTTLLP